MSSGNLECAQEILQKDFVMFTSRGESGSKNEKRQVWDQNFKNVRLIVLEDYVTYS